MTLAKEFQEKIAAGMPGLMIKSYEPDDALAEIADVCRKRGWQLMLFDVDRGALVPEVRSGRDILVHRCWKEEANNSYEQLDDKCTTIATVVAGLPGLTKGKFVEAGVHSVDAQMEASGVLVILNHNYVVDNPKIVQLLANRMAEYRARGLHIVFLSPTSEIPLPLQKLFESGHIKHDLPDRSQIKAILEATIEGNVDPKLITPALKEKAVDAAAGMTRLGAESAFALSLARHGTLEPDVVFDLKARALAETENAIEIYRGDLTLDDFGGGAFLKQFCQELLAERHENPRLRPKGIFMLGLPGIGKSLFAKCLGASVGRPVAILTLGALKSKYQGQSFENLTRMLDTIEAMAPAIVFIDEVEGQVSGGKDTGSMDAGTTSQMNSKLLSWLQDCKADVFKIVAANSIDSILRDMPEFIRLGRFDGLFFLDYPTRESKDEIWKIHLNRYEHIDGNTGVVFEDIELPDDNFWTGSEIEACCRLAKLRKRTIASIGEIMPIMRDQAAETIKRLRDNAKGRCFSAEQEQIYNPRDVITDIANNPKVTVPLSNTKRRVSSM